MWKLTNSQRDEKLINLWSSFGTNIKFTNIIKQLLHYTVKTYQTIVDYFIIYTTRY